MLSLRLTLRRLAHDVTDEQLVAWLRDPMARSIWLAYAWTRPVELEGLSGDRPLTLDRLAAALDAAGPSEDPTAPTLDHLAAVAYTLGRYDLARAWVAESTGPLADWIRGKLALREGDMDAALAGFVAAARHFEPEEVWTIRHTHHSPWGDSHQWSRMPARERAQVEAGLLQLARGDYRMALGYLAKVPAHWSDAVYVAERVLTVDELLAFVVEQPVSLPKAARERLRALLARRLMREDRPDEAVAWFDDPALADDAAAYADAFERAHGARNPIDRAAAWLEAAALARPGFHLFGTEGYPDFVQLDGMYEMAPFPMDGPWFGPDESVRALIASTDPEGRFHYRMRASRHAEAAANLLPHTSQAFGASLCLAAVYATHRFRDRQLALYDRFVEEGPLYVGSGGFGSHCPAPNLAALRPSPDAARIVWDRSSVAIAWLVGGPLAVLVGIALGGGMAGAAARYARRRARG